MTNPLPIPDAAYDAATEALDDYATAPYGDLRLNASRAAAKAVTASAPIVQRHVISLFMGTKQGCAVAALSMLSFWLITVALFLAAREDGPLGWLAIAALVGHLGWFAWGFVNKRRLRHRAQELTELLP